MGDEIVFFRLVIASVLVTAALAKRVEAGGPHHALPVLANGTLRAAEIVVALALLSGATARSGLLGAALLSAGFLAYLATSISRGRSGSCGCFGALDRDLSPLVSIFRACVLFALAASGLVWSWGRTNAHVWVWLEHLDRTQQIVAALGVASITASFAMPGRLGSLFARVNDRIWGASESPSARGTPPGFHTAGLPVGSAAPGWLHLFSGDRDERLVAVLFVQATLDAPASLPTCAGLRVIQVAAFDASDIAGQYRVPAVPSAVLVSADGVIRSRLAVGLSAIRALCSSAALVPQTTRQQAPAMTPAVADSGCAPCRS